MASQKQSLIPLLALFFTLSLSINFSEAVITSVDSGGIAVYWGQHSESQEGTLYDACKTGNYQYVIVGYLIVYDDGSTPTLNLAGHSPNIEHDIKYCQSRNIKVFLNIGQLRPAPSRRRQSTVSSEEAAEKLAEYLLENHLSNNVGPLGSVALDGISLSSVSDGANLKWDQVVKAVNASTANRRIYISAAPQCVFPDYFLNAAIQTGHIDYIWVGFFYNNPDCIYRKGDTSRLLSAWETWTTEVPSSTIFLGLTADESIAGYIPPDVLKADVLPTIKKSSNYGGVLLRSVYEDKLTDPSYSEQIRDAVQLGCRCLCGDGSLSSNFYRLYGRSLSL